MNDLYNIHEFEENSGVAAAFQTPTRNVIGQWGLTTNKFDLKGFIYLYRTTKSSVEEYMVYSNFFYFAKVESIK
jgi:hypothetical protein